jgi:hypothetical protein
MSEERTFFCDCVRSRKISTTTVNEPDSPRLRYEWCSSRSSTHSPSPTTSQQNPSGPLSNYDVHSARADDEFLPFTSILRQARTVQPLTPPAVVDLTCDDTDDDTEVSWHRKPTEATLHHISLTQSLGQSTSSSLPFFCGFCRPLHRKVLLTPPTNRLQHVLRRPRPVPRDSLRRIHLRGRYTLASVLPSTRLPSLLQMRFAQPRILSGPH